MGAFQNIGLTQLKTIAIENGIKHDCLTLPLTLTVLIKHFYKEHIKKDISDAELHAIPALRSAYPGDLVGSVADEDMLLGCLDKDGVAAFKAGRCKHAM